MQSKVWTDADFDRMSWHDNHVHGIRFVEGKDGEGDLILDIDHILEWMKGEGSGFTFRVLPVTLAFHGVTFPRIAIDCAAATAAFGPFMIHGIERRLEQRSHYQAQIWNIPITWPGGEIEFEARGFTQRGEGEPTGDIESNADAGTTQSSVLKNRWSARVEVTKQPGRERRAVVRLRVVVSWKRAMVAESSSPAKHQ